MRTFKIYAARLMGCMILLYCFTVGLPIFLLQQSLEKGAVGASWASGKLEKLLRQLGRPANWVQRKAQKLHPDGGDWFV